MTRRTKFPDLLRNSIGGLVCGMLVMISLSLPACAPEEDNLAPNFDDRKASQSGSAETTFQGAPKSEKKAAFPSNAGSIQTYPVSEPIDPSTMVPSPDAIQTTQTAGMSPSIWEDKNRSLSAEEMAAQALKNTNPASRNEAISKLAIITDPEASAILIQAAQKDDSSDNRLLAIQSFRASAADRVIDDQKWFTLLESSLDDPDSRVADVAEAALEEMNSRHKEPEVAHASVPPQFDPTNDPAETSIPRW